ncbi:uncharacterized protein [Amphiura filiformis]|uniref:uncharacterized protein n=1 Tax=Amphiura filiformis TaxID=82378 RepID=UPI003B217272
MAADETHLSPQCLDNLNQDFQHLHEMKSFLMEELTSYQKGTLGLGKLGRTYDSRKGLIRNLADGRKIRTLLLHGHEYTYNTLMLSPNNSPAVKDTQLWFVGFFGEQRKDTHEEIPMMVWNMSRDLDEECHEFPSMLAVCFAETCEGNWYNLVLMLGEKTLGHWHSSRLHRFAVRDLAPRYYSQVRIHVGQLPQGITESTFHLSRSIYLDYTAYQKDKEDSIARSVKHWNKDGGFADKMASTKFFTFAN